MPARQEIRAAVPQHHSVAVCVLSVPLHTFQQLLLLLLHKSFYRGHISKP